MPDQPYDVRKQAEEAWQRAGELEEAYQDPVDALVAFAAGAREDMRQRCENECLDAKVQWTSAGSVARAAAHDCCDRIAALKEQP